MNPNDPRIRRDYRTEWARLDTPPWRRLARNLAEMLGRHNWQERGDWSFCTWCGRPRS